VKVARSSRLIQDIVLQWRPTDIARFPGRGSGFTIHNRLLDALNVKYVLSTKTELSQFAPDQYDLVYSGDVRIYRNRNALPRAFMVHRAELVSGQAEAIQRLRAADFDPATTAVVEGEFPPEEREALSGAQGPGSSRVEFVEYRGTEVVLHVRTDRPGLLVLSDTYYPGWEAFVDGKARPIHPTNLALRSVFLEPGRHEVRFVFAPTPFRAGAAISLLALAGLVAFGLWSRFRREKAPSPRS
jgi:hypothetical protein